MANLMKSNFNDKIAIILQEQWARTRHPDKQKNNIQYRTHYPNEYNWDKNKRKNIYRSNTGHGGERQVYNRNPGQDNFNKQTAIIKIKN